LIKYVKVTLALARVNYAGLLVKKIRPDERARRIELA